MEAFALPQPQVIAGLILLYILELNLGFYFVRLHGSTRTKRILAWVLTAAAFFAALQISASTAPGIQMLANICALFFGLKAVAGVETSREARCLNWEQWLTYCLGWPGMRPAVFKDLGRRRLPGSRVLLISGARHLLEGIALFLVAAWVWNSAPIGVLGRRILASLLALPAISLGLHFGLVNIAAGLWRWRGADCRQLFRTPLKSRSLREFWGRRWNLAFAELAATTLYRPLSRTWGPVVGILGSFVMSGLFHEAAISFPVDAGYGLPTAYFLLHGVLALFEEHLERSGRPVESWGAGAHFWTAAWLILPAPLLFHPWFLEGVIWPVLNK